MSITLYAKPNYQGDSFEFDPNKTNHILYRIPEYSNNPKYMSMDTEYSHFNTARNKRFTIGSIKNRTNNFSLIIFDISKSSTYIINGSLKNTDVLWKSKNTKQNDNDDDDDTSTDEINGYIQIVKNPTNYKTAMIVFICLCISILIMLSFLFFNGTLEITTVR